MSNYTKTTDFEAKDSLPTGDAEKIIRGADFETEFDNIATAIATKADTAGPTFTGTVTIPTAAVTTLSLDGTTVTSTAAEINLLDGVTATTAELNLLDGVTATTAELNILDGVTATAVELNTLDGITATTAELNTLDGFTGTYEDLNFAQTLRASGVTGDEFDILDGLTATAAELNILDGATVTTAELNLLDGVTATTAELNILDGVTSTAAELNILDGVTSTAAELNLVDGSTAGTVVNSKAVVYGAAGEVNATTLQVGGAAITSTPAELNLLDGATVTTAEINILDGVTATTAELNILDGVTATAAELNTLDGITSTTAELNILDGVTATAAELNTMDGITATTAELNILDGVTADATELNKLDGVTATTSELNYVDVTTLGVVEASKAVTADANADVLFGDNDKAIFGAGSDLQIYHDGSASYIKDAGTGNLQIQGQNLSLEDSTGTRFLLGIQGGETRLYNQGNQKVAVNSTGIDVTGTATMDGLTVDGTGTFGALSSKIKVGLNGDSISSDADFYIQTSTADPLILRTNFTQRQRVDSNGDISFYEDTGTTAKFYWDASAESLGVGTTTPSSSYAVDATAGYRSSAAIPNFTLVETDASGQTWQLNSTGAKLSFRDVSRAADRVVIDTAGNVGIGTDSPDTLMHLSANTGATLTLESTDTAIATNEVIGAIDFYSNDASGIGAASRGSISLIAEDAAGAGSILFKTSNASTAATERMRIDSSGNVGIGTDSPAANSLTIEKSGTARLRLTESGVRAWDIEATSGDFRINNASGSSEAMRIDASGNLLVGKSSSSFTTAGVELAQGGIAGKVQIQRSASPLALVNLTDDGNILNFYKGTSAVGSIGVSSSDNLYIAANTADHAGLLFGTHTIYPMEAATLTGGTIDLGDDSNRFKDLYLSSKVHLQYPGNSYYGRVQIDSSNNLIFGAGANGAERMRILSTGGITFNGDTAQANALDDYEEGTWTPALWQGTHTYTSQVGRYVKIGKMVTVWGAMNISSRGSSSSELGISGLPFASSGNASAYASVLGIHSAYGNSPLLPTGVDPTGVSVESTSGYFRSAHSTNASYNINQLNSSGQVTFAFTYEAT